MTSIRGLAPSSRLVLLDLDSPDAAELQTLTTTLNAARQAGLAISHAYRTPRGARGSIRPPAKPLSPLPNEPVFLREEACVFSTRQFRAWAGPVTTAMVFLGNPKDARASAEAAAAFGRPAYLLVTPANAEGETVLHPFTWTPVPALRPGRVRNEVFSVAQGAANGQG